MLRRCVGECESVSFVNDLPKLIVDLARIEGRPNSAREYKTSLAPSGAHALSLLLTGSMRTEHQ